MSVEKSLSTHLMHNANCSLLLTSVASSAIIENNSDECEYPSKDLSKQ